MMRTIFDQIALHASFSPRNPAMVLPDRVLTYEMLHKGILSVQSVLTEQAISRNEPVAVIVDTPSRHLIVVLALLKSGYTYSSIRKNQIDTALHYGIRTLLTDDKLPIIPGAKTIWIDQNWFSRRAGGAENFSNIAFEKHRLVQISFSSGTTGYPKAFGRTFDVFQQRLMDKYFTGIASRKRFLTTVGFSGSALYYVLRVLMDGNTVFMCPQELAMSTVFSSSITELRASAIQARDLLRQREDLGYDVKLDLISTGSAALAVELADDLQRTFKCDLINTYSSTEGGTMGLAAGSVLHLRRFKGNCFVPLMKMEIVDDSDRSLPRGAEGRIRVKSPVLVRPYTGNLVVGEQTDEWFYPGDIGRIDEDGLLIVTGRSDEVINAGGVKYSPELMEDHLDKHPSITKAAVLRMPRDSGGAAPWVAVVSQHVLSLEELHRWMADNIPSELGSTEFAKLVQLEELPMTASGKIARQQLRQLLSDPTRPS